MNRYIASGFIGADPEIQRTNNDNEIANFSLAVQTFGNKSQAMWVKCVAFGKKVDYCSKYVKKGHKVIVQGKLNSFKNKDGNLLFSVIIDDIEIVSYKDGVKPEVSDNRFNNEYPKGESTDPFDDPVDTTVAENSKESSGLPWDIEF